MVFLYFTGLNPHGELQDYSIGSPDIETCFELLTKLVSIGCRLISIRLVVDTDCHTFLPVAAFDGQPMRAALQALQREWEEILVQN